MWRDFFGKEARIIGVDLNPNAKKWEKEGFEIFIGSQSDPEFWRDFIDKTGMVDIVLDDGGHTYEQQIVTTESLLPYINDGGLLIVEDTHTSYMDGFGDKKYSFIEYVKKLVDRINHRFGALSENGADDRIWSIRIYESIVAFTVNRPASTLLSEKTDNGGKNDHARDFRHADKASLQPINRIVNKLHFLTYIPGVRGFSRLVDEKIAHRRSSSKLKKYFDNR